MKKDILCEGITTLLYMAVCAFFLVFPSSNKYDAYDARVTSGTVSFVILSVPLFIRLVKNIVLHEKVKLFFTILTLILLVIYIYWLFMGRYYW